MTDDTELQKLARRYLDLWESQLSAMAADSELAAQLGRLFAATNASLLAGVQAQAGMAGGQETRREDGDAGGNTAADRTASSAAARGDGAMDVAELERRIAALERRLDAIERRLPAGD